jgi:hypothetical protein
LTNQGVAGCGVCAGAPAPMDFAELVFPAVIGVVALVLIGTA